MLFLPGPLHPSQVLELTVPTQAGVRRYQRRSFGKRDAGPSRRLRPAKSQPAPRSYPVLLLLIKVSHVPLLPNRVLTPQVLGGEGGRSLMTQLHIIRRDFSPPGFGSGEFNVEWNSLAGNGNSF